MTILAPSSLSARNTSFKTSRQKMVSSALATVARVSQPPPATSSLISHPTRVNRVSWYENEQDTIKLYHIVNFTSLDRTDTPRVALSRPNLTLTTPTPVPSLTNSATRQVTASYFASLRAHRPLTDDCSRRNTRPRHIFTRSDELSCCIRAIYARNPRHCPN